MRPVITLLTDFGDSDHYVAAMKGVILGICPEVNLIDVTHQVTPYAIQEAAYTLSQAWEYFPHGTTHVVVVDPGVGSARRPVLGESRGHRFVAPDNGVLSMIPELVVREITAERYFRHPVSQTFHGRDVFAPVAAQLAFGLAPCEFGPVIADPVILDVGSPQETGPGTWLGTVLKIDRFGNVITNFSVSEFAKVKENPFEMRIGKDSAFQYCPHYHPGAKGEFFVTAGSGGYLEVSQNQGDAGKALDASPGMPVELRFTGA